jgi:DNA-binding transcriptional ArsR family regulator
MELIFKALADPTRQNLLDALRQKDGQTLTDLEFSLDMTRFGVMKHLKLLEDANLIVTRKSGRFKYHYLNAVLQQDVMDRWVAPFLQPQAQSLKRPKIQTRKGYQNVKPGFYDADLYPL